MGKKIDVSRLWERLRQWMTDKGFRQWFRKDNFIIMILVGVLLVIIALPTEKNSRKEEEAEKSDTGGGMSASVLAEVEEGEQGTDEAYVAYMEERLTEALSQMANVGKVKVMITLKASSELVVEKEQPVSRSSTEEKDSQGGSRVTASVDSEENTVYKTNGSVSEPYVVKTLPPQIEGVLVVAEGAGSGTVNRTIVEIAQALFGVEAHKVKVVKMNTAVSEQ